MFVYGKYECFVMHMFVSCVYPVAVLNAAFCITCSLLMLVEDARSYGRGILTIRQPRVSPSVYPILLL